VDAASRAVDIAIYDLAPGPSGVTLARAVAGARHRGVRVRLLFNQEPRRRRKPLPPPGFVDYDFLRTLAADARAVSGATDLMHHKYAVRDGGAPDAAVWTGSANWTPSSWEREENVILRVHHPGVAAAFQANFDELWETRSVRGSGSPRGDWFERETGLEARAHFTPGGADELVAEIARRIASARDRLRVCSPVVSSGPILATLAEALRRPGLDAAGCYDRTQMEQVERQWRAGSRSAWKIPLWHAAREGMAWGAKPSTPYRAGAVHDFMHAKCVVADDFVFSGSYNLSHSGESNAENVLEINNRALADRFTSFVTALAERYK
jgi:phosphatidylserine/phosphatidylglycerophosphate/cardiolipin synthase-like enzyme